MRLNRIKSIVLLAALVLCAALGAVPAYAADAESAQVAFPVYATGVACHAELKDEAGNVVQTVAVPEDGSASFSVLCEGLGAHKFTLALSDTDTPVYTYDRRVYDLTVQLFYGDTGQILYTVEASDPRVVIIDGAAKTGKIEFNNQAGYLPCTADPPVRKILKGNPPVNSTFTFEMRAGNVDNPMPPGSVNGVKEMSILGPGLKEFGEMTFTEPGTYSYTIRELAGDASGYTYDTTIYTLQCIVTARSDRSLSCTQRFLVNGKLVDMPEAQFTNTYDPKGRGPKTGDESNALLWVILAAASLAILLVLLFFLKRRKKDEAAEQNAAQRIDKD